MVTLPLAVKLLGVSKPTAIKALNALQQAGILGVKPPARSVTAYMLITGICRC